MWIPQISYHKHTLWKSFLLWHNSTSIYSELFDMNIGDIGRIFSYFLFYQMLLGVVLYFFPIIIGFNDESKWKKKKYLYINCLLKWIALFFWFLFLFSLWNLLVSLLLSLCVYVWFLFICYLHNSLNSVGCYLCCIQGEFHSFTWDRSSEIYKKNWFTDTFAQKE